MKCLIIAAGGGRRLREVAESKPLLPLLGVPLIERVVRAAREAGADGFVVVLGYRSDAVQAFLNDLADRLGVSVRTVVNENWADSENGVSILQARSMLAEPFLLVMADHLFDPRIIRSLVALPLEGAEIALAVDGELDNPLVDPSDVTRVNQRSGFIRDIGKNLAVILPMALLGWARRKRSEGGIDGVRDEVGSWSPGMAAAKAAFHEPSR